MGDRPLKVHAVIEISKPGGEFAGDPVEHTVKVYPTEERAEEEAEKIREVHDDAEFTEWHIVEKTSFWIRPEKYDEVPDDEWERVNASVQEALDHFPLANLFFDFDD